MPLKPSKSATSPPPPRILGKKPTKTTLLPRESLWKGPIVDGITYSLLCKFLVCRERFRLKVVEGLKEDEGFKHAMHYGSLWHECEEGHAAGDRKWIDRMWKYAEKLREEYPSAEKEINKWSSICATQFPIYINYWRKQVMQKNRRPLIEEKAYRIPYGLPSGRVIVIRGKIDSAYHIPEKGKSSGGTIYIQENKTKGEIDEQGLQQTVDQNLQTMIYHVALRHFKNHEFNVLPTSDFAPFIAAVNSGAKIGGTLYNVVRRPLSDRFSIKQKKSETQKEFIKRLGESIKAKPEHFFKRWLATITPQEIINFEKQCLIPILEQLCDWWESVKDDPFNPWQTISHHSAKNISIATIQQRGVIHDGIYHAITTPNPLHYRTPFGVYNPLGTGMRGDYFDYLTTGSSSKLTKINNLFPELT